MQSLLNLLSTECRNVQSKKKLRMLLHIIVHLILILLLGGRWFFTFYFFVLNLLIFFIHKIVFFSIVLIKFCLFLWTKLLPNMCPSYLCKSCYSAISSSYLYIVCTWLRIDLSPCLLLWIRLGRWNWSSLLILLIDMMLQ